MPSLVGTQVSEGSQMLSSHQNCLNQGQGHCPAYFGEVHFSLKKAASERLPFLSKPGRYGHGETGPQPS